MAKRHKVTWNGSFLRTRKKYCKRCKGLLSWNNKSGYCIWHKQEEVEEKAIIKYCKEELARFKNFKTLGELKVDIKLLKESVESYFSRDDMPKRNRDIQKLIDKHLKYE